MGHFGNKNAKWVKFPQFEILLGLSVTLETLEAKVKIGGYFMRVKCNFPYILLLIFIFVSFYYYYYFLCPHSGRGREIRTRKGDLN
jgi:hypothetical protein